MDAEGSRQKLPRNLCPSVNEAKGSGRPQWACKIRASRTWVFTKSRVRCKTLHSDRVRHNMERHYFPGETWLWSRQSQKNKQNKTLRVSHRRDRQDADFTSSAGPMETLFVVLFSATTCFLILQQGKEGGKYTERK